MARMKRKNQIALGGGQSPAVANVDAKPDPAVFRVIRAIVVPPTVAR
jgi:hypothetical protein